MKNNVHSIQEHMRRMRRKRNKRELRRRKVGLAPKGEKCPIPNCLGVHACMRPVSDLICLIIYSQGQRWASESNRIEE